MKLLRIHHAQITVPPGAETEARAFYCALLGLQEVPKPAALAVRGGFWLQLGDAQIHVGVEENPNRAASRVHVAYEVDDLPGLAKELAARGVEMKDNEKIPGYERFEVRDPFGNRVEFLQQTRSTP